MGSVTRGEGQALGGTDSTEATDADENDRPTLPGIRLPEPWPERSAVIPQSLRTRTSRWRAVAAAAVEGGAARVSLVDPEEFPTPAAPDSGARRVARDDGGDDDAAQRSLAPESPTPESPPQPTASPEISRDRPRARATVRMIAPGLQGPTGTRKMWAQSYVNASPDRSSLEPRPVSRRWSLVAIVLGALCVTSVVVALSIARHRDRQTAPAQTRAHVP